MRPPLEGVIVVTGASSGIGAALARLLAERASALILVARRADRLLELRDALLAARPGLRVEVIPADLSDAAEVERLVRALEGEAVDVLINNAGLGDRGLFERASWSKLDFMIRVNVLAATRLAHAFVPGMVRRGRGGILNVSSGFGMVPSPGAAAYVGTKHFVTGFSESLRMELAGTGVVVSQLCPGPVATEFESIAGNPTGYAVPWWFEVSVEHCARVALRGFSAGKATIVPGFFPSIGILLGAWTPRFVLRALTGPAGRWLRRRPPALLTG